MQIQLLSDLHLEAHPQFRPEPVSNADVLVLAGDIGSYQDGSLLEGAHFGLERFSPLPQWGAWPTPVVFVPGNHEYDMQDFDAAHARLRLTRSTHVPDYDWCVAGVCRPLAEILPSVPSLVTT